MGPASRPPPASVPPVDKGPLVVGALFLCLLGGGRANLTAAVRVVGTLHPYVEFGFIGNNS
jgi:hypothetical protein